MVLDGGTNPAWYTPIMRREVALSRCLRVGIVALAPTDELLSNVGMAAWTASGAREVEEALPADAFQVIRPLVVHGGNVDEVRTVLRDWCDAPNRAVRCDLIFTVGGDGISQRDVIPDATRDVIERELPGLADRLKAAPSVTAKQSGDAPDRSADAVLSRATAGTRGQTLIVNIPGFHERPGAAVRLLLPLLPDALAALGVDAFEEPRTVS